MSGYEYDDRCELDGGDCHRHCQRMCMATEAELEEMRRSEVEAQFEKYCGCPRPCIVHDEVRRATVYAAWDACGAGCGACMNVETCPRYAALAGAS